VYTVPVEQQWVSRIHKAAEAAVARGEVSYVFSENVSNTDYPRVMREYCEGGARLVLGEVFGVEQAAREVASEYPDTAFLMGSSLKPDLAVPNFAVFDNYIQDASYLTGIIAGAVTQSGRIGMVGGFPIPEVNRLMNAFMAGVRETRPDAAFQVAFIGSWFDPPKAKETAIAMIEAGADVMYAERFGVSDAAQERGVLAIGNVIDTQADYPQSVVTSALWHFEPTFDAAVAAVTAGAFEAADYGVHSFMRAGRLLRGAPRDLRGQGPEPAMALVAERQPPSWTEASPSRSTTPSRSRAECPRPTHPWSCASTGSPSASARSRPTTASASR
jgi:basic membrane lipoprotein Med (substrate-binding protein (PBP1-ABC) superfamily)